MNEIIIQLAIIFLIIKQIIIQEDFFFQLAKLLIIQLVVSFLLVNWRVMFDKIHPHFQNLLIGILFFLLLIKLNKLLIKDLNLFL